MFTPPMLLFVSIFHLFSTVKAGGHTLLVFATFIKVETVFPEFSALLMLDDFQVAYYDSVKKTALRRGLNLTDPVDDEDQKDFRMGAAVISHGMDSRMQSLRNHFNQTDDGTCSSVWWTEASPGDFHGASARGNLSRARGIQTLQRLTGCELLGNGEEGRMIVMEAFDGESGDVAYYNKHEGSLLTDLKWPINSELYKTYVKYILKELFHPLCIKVLKKYLRKEKNQIEKQVKPRVQLLPKTLPDSEGVKVTCLATGFYPRHINLTLLRDGQPVSDHQITGGELLPNGDEMYQMRKSLEVRAEELQHHQYTCTAEHLTLDNMITIIIAETSI